MSGSTELVNLNTSKDAELELLRAELERKNLEINQLKLSNTKQLSQVPGLQRQESSFQNTNNSRNKIKGYQKFQYEQFIKDMLPINWAFAKDKDGRIYFKNHSSRTTSWDPPVELDLPYMEYIRTSQKVDPEKEAKIADIAILRETIRQQTISSGVTKDLLEQRINEQVEKEVAKFNLEQQIEKDLARVPPNFDTESPWFVLNGARREMVLQLISMAVDLFKITMACLLTVFVPQTCSDGDYYDGYHNYSQECRPMDNMYIPLLTSFETFVLFWNFISLLFCVLHFIVMGLREKYIIFHFDCNPDVPDNAMPSVVKQYPELGEKLLLWNNLLFASSIINIAFLVCNFIVSAVVIFDPKYFAGTKGATVFLTNTLLVVSLFKISLQNAFLGVYETKAFSCVDFEPISFNAIDAVWLHNHINEVKQKNNLV